MRVPDLPAGDSRRLARQLKLAGMTAPQPRPILRPAPAAAIRVLGPFEIIAAGRPVPVPGRIGHLLHLLFLFPGRPCSHRLLYSVLWPDEDRWPDHPHEALQVCVSRGRQALQDVPGGSIEARPGAYQAAAAPGVIDLERFRAHRHQARILLRQHDSQGAAAQLQRALACWPSAEVEGIPGLPAVPEADAEATVLAEERRLAAHDLAHILLCLGQHEQILPDLRARTVIWPDSELAATQLMFALYQAGRTDEALEAYGRLERSLKDTFETGPGHAAQRLLTEIRSGGHPSPPAVGLPIFRPAHPDAGHMAPSSARVP